ncbi:MAG TPA: ABC transporter substrate-binding protein [Tepidisphaeraceae bacterium]|jgi:putative ABC transport system substrate-binding protein
MLHVRRRDFITLLGGLTAWPLAARAQQPTMPVVGFLSSLTPGDGPLILAAFHRGLNEAGYLEGRNVAIEYRWAEGHYDRLPAMAADLVRRPVVMIAAISGTPSALAAKAATADIPIVFAIGGDPVTPGLVSNLNRPGGNLTGVTFFTAPLSTKRLEMVRELAPKATTVGVLVNPNNPPSVLEGKDVPVAAQTVGLRTSVLNASTAGQIDDAFAAIVGQRIGGLYVSADPLFFNQRAKLATLAARHAVPAIYADREIAEAGGLISYGASRSDAYRQAGVYTGRILKGEKPGDLPVVLPTRFELVINLKTAKALGLEVPPTLLARADEVIE